MFWKHRQQEDFIIKAEDGIFRSWALYGVVPNVQAEYQDPIEAYLDISMEGYF